MKPTKRSHISIFFCMYFKIPSCIFSILYINLLKSTRLLFKVCIKFHSVKQENVLPLFASSQLTWQKVELTRERESVQPKLHYRVQYPYRAQVMNCNLCKYFSFKYIIMGIVWIFIWKEIGILKRIKAAAIAQQLMLMMVWWEDEDYHLVFI